MTSIQRTLLADCRAFVLAAEGVCAFAPDRMRAKHLKARARELVGRIEDVMRTEAAEVSAPE